MHYEYGISLSRSQWWPLMLAKNSLVKALFTMILCAMSCEHCKEHEDTKKKSIIIGIAQEPDSLFIPFKEMMASEEVVRAGIYTLSYFNQDRRIVPWAAQEIPSFENGLLEIFKVQGHNKMRTTWHIRDDFFWPDGKPLNAEDFLFTFELYRDPKQEILDRSVVEKIESMHALGEHKKTLVVVWKEPYAYFHNFAQHEALPKHLIKPLYDHVPEALKKSRFGQVPALAGAFTIQEWSPGSHIIAKRNSYASPFLKPHLDEIMWRIIPQTSALESNLVAGTIDAISPTGLSLDEALRFEKRHKDRFDFYYTEGLVWEHIDFNLDNIILKDKRVRMALAYASDREGIVNNLFKGRQVVAHGTEPKQSLYFNSAITKYNYDPDKARALLEEAGWFIPSGEITRQKDGALLTLTLMSTSGDKTRERVEQFLQQQWRDIGINIIIKNEPAKVFFGETMRKRNFEALAMYSWIKDPLKISDTLWGCDYIPSAANNFQGQNMPGWCHEKCDALLKKSSTELNEKKRIAMGQELEALFALELPALPLYFRMEVSVSKKGLKNWKPTGTLQPITWNAHQWHWDSAKKGR
jgi:peptide/nickel transport system substrate-binding protein